MSYPVLSTMLYFYYIHYIYHFPLNNETYQSDVSTPKWIVITVLISY